MRIKISRSQWETIGKTAGWMKKAQEEEQSTSLKDRMKAFLRSTFGSEADDSDMEVAIYWFANHWHGGQTSELYSILSTSPYRPGPISTLESEGDFVTMMYEALESEFANKDKIAKSDKMSKKAQEVDAETGISKGTFMKYVKIQYGGKYNMVTDGDIVMRLLGVDKPTYMNLLQNYDKLIAKWPEAENQ